MNKIKQLRAKIYWWFLDKSKITHYCMVDFLTTLCFELQRFDFDGEDTKKKYICKLKKYTEAKESE